LGLVDWLPTAFALPPESRWSGRFRCSTGMAFFKRFR
jgi:hypothetical protein